MKKNLNVLLILVILLFSINSIIAQNVPIDKANYKLAARFSPNQLKKMLFSTSVDPHWLKLSERFWYSYETSNGKTFYIVDPAKKSKRPLFDNVKMAAMLTRFTKDPYDANHLPIDKIKFIKKETAIQFEVESSQEEKEDDKKKEEEKEKKPKKKVFYFE